MVLYFAVSTTNLCFFVFASRVFDKKEFFRQNYNRELYSFKTRLGLNFDDESILLTAFTHESYKEDNVDDANGDNSDSSAQVTEHNARLSLLGKYYFYSFV